MRFVWSLATILLLAALSVMALGASTEFCLVTIPYEGLEQLRQLASWGLQIINYQGNVLAALSCDGQIERLRQAGFQVTVLDWAADTRLYYLAYPSPADDFAPLPAVEAAYPYARDVHIVRATSAQAEALAMRGVEIVKLPNCVILPRRQPTMADLQARLAYSPGVQAMVDAVSPTLLVHHVCKLQDDDSLDYCNEFGTRYSYATAKLNEAAQYLYDEYATLGLSVTCDAFVYNSKPMTNVVAELSGVGPVSNHIYIICAHYDSISWDSDRYKIAPGADDNASGSAAVLEAARILSQYQFPRTLRFVNFAGEELGLIGSAHYAGEAFRRGDLIDGVINLDMIGYESVPPNDHIVEIHAGIDPASIALAETLIDNISEYGLLLVPQNITETAVKCGDHASFWNRGYAAILGIEDLDDFNPHYHSRNDTLANMQTQMMVEYTKACVATLAELASMPNETTPTPTCTAPPILRWYLPIVLCKWTSSNPTRGP